MKKVFVFAISVLLIGSLLQTTGCKKKVATVQNNVTSSTNQENLQAQPSEIDQRNTYYSSVMTQKMILRDAFFALDNLIKQPKPTDQTWNFQVDSNLVKIQKVIQDKYGKTCPAVYNDANIEYSKALDAFQFFVVNYPDAVKNMNDELLRSCSEKLKLGYQSIEKTGQILDAKK